MIEVNGKKLDHLDVFRKPVTVPDCIVVSQNKVGGGHGEAKLYVASKEEMYSFFGTEKFTAHCFMLKTDLIAYMMAVENEYKVPSQDYVGKADLPNLWKQRMDYVLKMDDVIFFDVKDQAQIAGGRGYINSRDDGYQIIREIALPLISYIFVEKVGYKAEPMFYWRLQVDFDAIWEKGNGPLVYNYGKKRKKVIDDASEYTEETDKKTEIKRARVGQGKYREQLLKQCPFCPITGISEERLLIASHIKPWCSSNDDEKIDPYNGYTLSPLYDKLFDKGYITFTEDRHMIISEYLSPYTWKLLNIKNNTFIQNLPMDDNRIKYLKFHHDAVFRGSYQSAISD